MAQVRLARRLQLQLPCVWRVLRINPPDWGALRTQSGRLLSCRPPLRSHINRPVRGRGLLQLRDSHAISRDWVALADAETALRPTYQQRRKRAFCAFNAWCLSTFEAECSRLACSSLLLAYALRGFGLWLYASGAPRPWLTDAINLVGARWPEWRAMRGPAWQVNRAWAQAEPGWPRVVIPASLLRAMFGVSLLWGWTRFAGLLLLGFYGMLRPDGFLSASRRDLVLNLPSDRLGVSGDAFLWIAEAKTRCFMRHQHTRISDHGVVQFLELAFGPLGRGAPCALQYGAASFRSRWNAVLSRPGVPSHVAASGPTPGSLRGSGATEFYFQTEDVPRIAWRGRWRKVETLEHYLQEVAAQLLLTDLPPAARAKTGEFATASSRLLEWFLRLGSASLWGEMVRAPGVKPRYSRDLKAVSRKQGFIFSRWIDSILNRGGVSRSVLPFGVRTLHSRSGGATVPFWVV